MFRSSKKWHYMEEEYIRGMVVANNISTTQLLAKMMQGFKLNRAGQFNKNTNLSNKQYRHNLAFTNITSTR